MNRAHGPRLEPINESDLSVYLRRRARVQATRAERVSVLRARGLTHEQVRLELGLSVRDYRAARRWLRDAVGRSVVSDGSLSIADALQERASAAIAAALRVAALTPDARGSRRQVRMRLRLTEQQFADALEWVRDAMAVRSRMP